eukprot:682923-Alexandrium_andersonii.AAC.1
MAAAAGAETMPGVVAPAQTVVARPGLMDRAWCGVDRLGTPSSSQAAPEERCVLLRPLWEPERSDASGSDPEPTTTTGDQVARRP